MNKCELCKFRATTYCDSDDAHLCWSCDALVHGANFLVARHSRTLLCRKCHSPTPWKASGPHLAPTLSFCHACTTTHRHLNHHQSEAHNQDFTTAASSTSSPPPSSSSSSCTSTKSMKRTRETSCSTHLNTPFQKNDIYRSFSRRTCCRRRRRRRSKVRI
ncbi:B-box type zinc finger family protein [Euphorbia peplus]|nr:B-box type zinc finger family protein [Euphorbia peplus]